MWEAMIINPKMNMIIRLATMWAVTSAQYTVIRKRCLIRIFIFIFFIITIMI